MKTFLLLGAVMFGLLQSAGAYSLGGPIGNDPKPNGVAQGDAWQQGVIGYGLAGDLNAPKNIGEGYRRNTKVMYYAFDANFLGFFGSNGVTAVDNSFVILNGTFTNNPTGITHGLDGYSATLSEFPIESRHINYQAQALGLYDLKSVTLGAMMEQLGLADPVRYAWTLHDRAHVGTIPCPVGQEYLVVQRNFDIVSSPLNQVQYSPYVNNTLYSYQIYEACSGPNPLALAVPYSVDPLADVYSPVASSYGGLVAENTSLGVLLSVTPGIYSYGSFYSGLTRDDVAGLRSLLQTNNINWETAAAGSLLLTATTNFTSPQLFPVSLATNGVLYNGTYYGTADLGAFLGAASTNPPATLQALYPGVTVLTSSNYFTVVTVTNVTAYFTNFIGSPAGSPPVLVFATNLSLAPLTIYVDTFANIITNHYRTNAIATLVTTTVGPLVGAPAGSPLVTNTTTKTINLNNVPSGDFYILPTNSPCGLDIVSTLLTNVVVTTNLIVSTSSTNSATTNSSGYSYSQSLITYLTNYVFVIAPVTCGQTANATGLYEGIEGIQFVKTSYDSLLGQFFQPITNNYTMFAVTNSQVKLQNFQRVVTRPDFLFSAADMATGPSSTPHPSVYSFLRNVNFNQANVLPGEAGPGTIDPSTTIIFDKVGPVFYNGTATFADVLDGTPYFTESPGGDITDTYFAFYFLWGSFDSSTNAPVVYPDGTSIENIQNQILIQVTPSAVPNGFNGVVYPSTTFTATGGSFTRPYTWSATGLPPGMDVSPAGTLEGTPSQSGTFVFTLILTDNFSRTAQWNYSLTIQ